MRRLTLAILFAVFGCMVFAATERAQAGMVGSFAHHRLQQADKSSVENVRYRRNHYRHYYRSHWHEYRYRAHGMRCFHGQDDAEIYHRCYYW